MRVHVVSDVHGRVDALARAKDGADALVCLGDLLLFVDYADHGAGVLGELFGAEAVGRFVELRTDRRFDEAREFSRSLWARVVDRDAAVAAAIRKQYAETFAAFPTPTYLTYGNVDVPTAWPEFARDGVHVHDGSTAELDGWRFGFVGGGLRTPMRTPFEISDADYAAKVAAVGEVDVLCSHIPPAVAGADVRRGRAALRARQRGAARGDPGNPAAVRPFRARAPAAAAADADRPDRVRQRRPLPRHGPAVGADLAAVAAE